MKNQPLKLYCLTFLLLAGFALFAHQSSAQKPNWQPNIPKTWVDAEMEELEVPLADPIASPKHISAADYYRIPEMKIYKSYPVYGPGKVPPGYFDWLKKQEPQIAFDASQLKTEADWIKAGEIVFHASIGFEVVTQTPARGEKPEVLLTRDGRNPYSEYFVREKGGVEIGFDSSADCHTRVMPNGTVLKGGQGNGDLDKRERPLPLESNANVDMEAVRNRLRRSYGAPWIKPDPQANLAQLTFADVLGSRFAIPPGVSLRQGAALHLPLKVPDLIGIKERKYLDATGLQLHRGAVDLMRYAALNQGMDVLASYHGFIPLGIDFKTLPDLSKQQRYSDEQLYALALYLYSLKPPPNPNKFDALAQRGQKVFQTEGCASCHTPPLYTNNKLMPVDGFTVPPEHKKKYDILPMSIGTDPRTALTTRRGTGYYKVPSLKGVWYRGPFEHSGSVATLEDWFDPKRLKDDYVPTGFVGYGIKTRAVKGHEFGLQLAAEDKRALIAFLKTL